MGFGTQMFAFHTGECSTPLAHSVSLEFLPQNQMVSHKIARTHMPTHNMSLRGTRVWAADCTSLSVMAAWDSVNQPCFPSLICSCLYLAKGKSLLF